jgi:hypothetical protein
MERQLQLRYDALKQSLVHFLNENVENGNFKKFDRS